MVVIPTTSRAIMHGRYLEI